jgi:hypothetical protein
MGLEYSCMTMLQSIIGHDAETITTKPDGTIIEKRQNWLIAPTAIVAVTTILLVYIDNGKGAISKSFGKVCLHCSQ